MASGAYGSGVGEGIRRPPSLDRFTSNSPIKPGGTLGKFGPARELQQLGVTQLPTGESSPSRVVCAMEAMPEGGMRFIPPYQRRCAKGGVVHGLRKIGLSAPWGVPGRSGPGPSAPLLSGPTASRGRRDDKAMFPSVIVSVVGGG
jgi:hypothetical protein